ncbi:hypothetical protein E4U28_003575 [Claviceps purpurea]|nr:hypothetical protein E4U28_003575 [Claviceps purpurea]
MEPDLGRAQRAAEKRLMDALVLLRGAAAACVDHAQHSRAACAAPGSGLVGEEPGVCCSRAVRCNLAAGHVATLSFQFPGPSASYSPPVRVIHIDKVTAATLLAAHRPSLGVVGQSRCKHSQADPSEPGVMLNLNHKPELGIRPMNKICT